MCFNLKGSARKPGPIRTGDPPRAPRAAKAISPAPPKLLGSAPRLLYDLIKQYNLQSLGNLVTVLAVALALVGLARRRQTARRARTGAGPDNPAIVRPGWRGAEDRMADGRIGRGGPCA